MSYTKSDCAVDVCEMAATVDIDQLDPDELYEFATRLMADCRAVRDDFDENGYAK